MIQTVSIFDRIRTDFITVVFVLVSTFVAGPAIGASQVNGQWLSGFHGPGVDGDVLTSLVWDDGRGEALYIGGRFRTIEDAVVNGLARWDGQTWESLGDGVSVALVGDVPEVRALAVHDGQLIAAGSFAVADGVVVNGLARWDGSQWSSFSPFQFFLGQQPGVITALAVLDNALYAGGNFSNVGQEPISALARWDGEAWHGLGNGLGGFSPQVNALGNWQGQLAVAGVFDTAGGQLANNIAAWDGDGWTVFGEEPQAVGVQSFPRVLLEVEGDLVVAGSIAWAGQTAVSNIARWTGSAWLGFDDTLQIDPTSLAMFGDSLYVGGSPVGGGSLAVARWSGTSWEFPGLMVQPGPNGTVHSLSELSGNLIAVGAFSRVSGTPAGGLARFDGVWQPLSTATGVNAGLARPTPLLAASENRLLVGVESSMAPNLRWEITGCRLFYSGGQPASSRPGLVGWRELVDSRHRPDRHDQQCPGRW